METGKGRARKSFTNGLLMRDQELTGRWGVGRGRREGPETRGLAGLVPERKASVCCQALFRNCLWSWDGGAPQAAILAATWRAGGGAGAEVDLQLRPAVCATG